MIRYLLDSNIIAEPIRKIPNQQVLRHLQQAKDQIAISATIWHEMCFGCQRLPDSQRRRDIEFYLNHVVTPTIPCLPYDEKAATWHAAERARLTKMGLVPPFADGQIAAVAYVNGLILVTNNEADYQNYQGLQMENWFNASIN